MIKNLPIYEVYIDTGDTETGMFVISLVNEPAIEKDFLAFSSDKLHIEYKVVNEEEQKVFGAIAIADKPIYRRDNSGFEYYVVFNKTTIAKMAEKYFKMGLQNNVDTEHNFKLEDGVTLTQMFIKDSSKGISPIGFEDVTDGSLFAEFHVENNEVWTDIKEGKYKGFSLAGDFLFNEQPINDEDAIYNEILSMLDKISKMK